MKQFILTLTLLLVTATQLLAQEYLEKIADTSCTCLSEALEDTSSLNRKKLKMKLGLCMISASKPYAKQLKSDYNFDLSKIDDRTMGEELGRLIGMEMIEVCPETFMLLTEYIESEEPPQEPPPSPFESGKIKPVITGEIVKIQQDDFVTFFLRNEVGEIQKYSWVTYVETEIEDFEHSYRSLKGQKVQLQYNTEEVFNVDREKYETRLVLERIRLIE